MLRRLATILATAAMLATGTATAAHAADKPAPTTVKGYERMWAAVARTGDWGGGDVSLSVPLRDGRVVWLYGDTFSPRNGMVHSSALVQTGGTLRAANRGAQVLPNGRTRKGRKTVHWIEAAEQTGRRTLAITAMPVSTGTANGWDFHRTTDRSRVAKVRITDRGDLRFVRWTGWTTAPAPFTDLAEPEPNHWTYEHRAHPWATLANGKTLMTHANNWTLPDGDWKRLRSGRIDYRAYAPTFYAGDGVERRAY